MLDNNEIGPVVVSIDGEQIGSLSYGQSISKDVSKGTHRITATHSSFAGVASFTLVANEAGSHSRLNIASEPNSLGGNTVRFFCENCEFLFSG